MFKKSLSILVCFTLVFVSIVEASKRPEIIRCDATYVQQAVAFNIAWLSSYPVTTVTVLLGDTPKVIKVDEYDNTRTRDGYTGEVSVQVPVAVGFRQPSIAYVVVLEDELRQKSEQKTGTIALLKRDSQDDHWAEDKVRPILPPGHPPVAGGKSGDIVDKLIDTMQRHDIPPTIDHITVNILSPETANFSTKANDDKGLREIIFKVFDSAGIEVAKQTLTNLGKVWQGTSQTFTLKAGTYKVTAQAFDTAGNASKEQSATFNMAGIALPPPPPPPLPPPALKGSLTVSIIPEAVVNAGAMWRVDANAKWQKSSETLTDLPVGQYVVQLKDIAGWTTPEQPKVNITADNKTNITVAYIKNIDIPDNKTPDVGKLIGLEILNGELRLSKTSTTFPFIWVPNSNDGTISKVDTNTGKELGRYRTGPTSDGSPSRTTVDLKGNCWVGNRNTGTAVKVGLLENGQCVDRNGNGKIDTSEGSQALEWGKDECVLLEVVLNDGKEQTNTPGMQSSSNNSGPRGFAVDNNNNVWIGTYGTKKYYYVDGESGKILRKIDLSPVNHMAYGAIIDKRGILWSADIGNRHILRLDTATDKYSVIPLGHQAYGLGMDKKNHLFVAGWCDNKLTRINTETAKIEWTVDTGDSCSRGVAVTDDGDVWVANSWSNNVSRWSNDGTKKSVIPVGSHPTGVATAHDNKVWAVNYFDNTVVRIDPATNKVDLNVAVGTGHYGYSDMTGIVVRTTTTKMGNWIVNFDSQSDKTQWSHLSWHEVLPKGTSVKVQIRSSADKQNWSAWEDVVKDAPLKNTPAGRHIEVNVTLQSTGDDTPTFSKLKIYFKERMAQLQ